MQNKPDRPKNLDLMSIKFPVAAIMSVGHRASGILMFLATPYFLYLLQLSLTSDTGYQLAIDALHGPVVTIIAFAFIWILTHHILAGIRYFLLDLDIGLDKKMAQQTALAVIIGGVVIFICFTLYLFL
jgi:succinate dehydrogenase / fumarate reductase cytochrome b subunit